MDAPLSYNSILDFQTPPYSKISDSLLHIPTLLRLWRCHSQRIIVASSMAAINVVSLAEIPSSSSSSDSCFSEIFQNKVL